MVSQEIWKKTTTSTDFNYPIVAASYIPFSHSSDRLKTWWTILSGGRIGFVAYNYQYYSEDEDGSIKFEMPNTN